MKRRFHHASGADVLAVSFPKHQGFGTANRYEAMLWRQFALAGFANRNVPSFVEDEEIAATLRRMHADPEYILPWQFTDEFWESIQCKRTK